MAKKQLGAGNRYAEFRSGLGGFIWEGIATKVDPGASPPNRPRILENVRIQGGSIISRPDFDGPGAVIPPIPNYDLNVSDSNNFTNSKNRLGYDIDGIDALWTPHWAAEFNSVGGTRLWWGAVPPLTYVPIGDTWEITQTGGSYGFIDTDSDPVLNTAGIYFSADSWAPCIEKYATEVYIGDFGALRKIHMVMPPAGYAPADVLSTPGDTVVLEYPGFRTTAMIEHQGKLWLLLTDPSGIVNAHLYSYDGYVAVDEHTFGVSGATGGALASYKNELVVTLQGTGEIYSKAPDGTWTTVANPAFDSSPFLNSMAVYRDKLYIMDGVDTIWSYDGSILTSEHVIAPGGTVAPAYLYCCCVFNDVLYYGWTDTYTVAGSPAVGRINWTGQPNDGDTLTIGSRTYRFKNTLVTEGDVWIHPSNSDWTYTYLYMALTHTGTYGTHHKVSTAHADWTFALDTVLNRITMTSIIMDTAYNSPPYTMTDNVTNMTFTLPAGAVTEVRQHVKLGKFDDDNDPAVKWEDEWGNRGTLFVPNFLGVSKAADDWMVSAMAFYRGRLWVACSGIPGGNSAIMTHQIQYAPYDGWFICDSSSYTEAYADQVGYQNDPRYGRGPGHNTGYDFSAFTSPQIYYFRSI